MRFLHACASFTVAAAFIVPVMASGYIGQIDTRLVCRGERSADECAREVLISTPRGALSIIPVNENIYRVTVADPGDTLPYRQSQSAVLPPSGLAGGLRMGADGTGVTLSSPTTTIKVDRATGRVSFYNSAGEPVAGRKRRCGQF